MDEVVEATADGLNETETNILSMLIQIFNCPIQSFMEFRWQFTPRPRKKTSVHEDNSKKTCNTYHVKMVLLIRVNKGKGTLSKIGMGVSIMSKTFVYDSCRCENMLCPNTVSYISILWTTRQTPWSAGYKKNVSYLIRP